jgi:nucleoside-diphosphate-sugar epimerase
MQNKVAIIGCGYVGRAVARHWQSSLTVTATTTQPTKVAELAAICPQVVVLDGNDKAALRSLLTGQSTLLLSVGAPHPDAYEATYLDVAKTLVSVLPDVPTVQQVIYTSSYAVYGDYGGQWVDESTPLRPGSPKKEILAAAEQVLLSAASPTRKICVFRLGGIYGPGRELVKIFRRAAGTTRPGTGNEPGNWVHLDDIVGAIALAQAQGLDGIYNLVSEPMPNRELLDRVCAAHHLPPITWDPHQVSPKSYNAKVMNQKLRSAGYEFLHPVIDETM